MSVDGSRMRVAQTSTVMGGGLLSMRQSLSGSGFVLACSLVLLTTACGKSSNSESSTSAQPAALSQPPAPLVGTWQSLMAIRDPRDANRLIQNALQVSAGSIVQSASCSFARGGNLLASATCSASFSDSEITINEDKRESVSLNGFEFCEVECVRGSVIRFSFAGRDRIRISRDENGAVITQDLRKIR
jgi:hypothetical protein